MIKFHLYYDKDAETEWLNKLCLNGWAMKKFFAGFYWFEPCEKGKYTYQVDFGNSLFSVSEDYRQLMEDTGVEIVQTWGYWIILRKPSCEGPFELYTDVDSSIEHYSKIKKMFKAVTIIELLVLILEILAALNGLAMGYVFACIIGAITFALINAVIKTNNVIADLKERKGEIVSSKRRKNISMLLPLGLLLNSFALYLKDSISSQTQYIFQILAIILMIIGIYKTRK